MSALLEPFRHGHSAFALHRVGGAHVLRGSGNDQRVMELVIVDSRVLLRNLNSSESDLRQSQGCTGGRVGGAYVLRGSGNDQRGFLSRRHHSRRRYYPSTILYYSYNILY